MSEAERQAPERTSPTGSPRGWSPWISVVAAAIVGVSCGESPRPGNDEGPAVQIVAPAEGSVIEGARVTIRLGARGVSIVPAGTEQPNSGHHHLFIDRDPSPVGETIPTGEGIVHLGAAQTEYIFDGLAPGEHTVIAVLGDFQHVRLATVATDTVRFTVTPP